MVTRFGQNPPGVRSYVRHVFVLDGTQADGSVKKSGGSSDDMFGVWGPSTQTVFLHENFHSVDQDFHDNANFTAAANLDNCVPDSYSKASPAELFAQQGVIWEYDHQVPLATRGYDGSCMKRQLQVMGDYLKTGPALGACFTRRPNSPTITKSLAKLNSPKVEEPWVNPMVIEFFD
jgi:hypothetical protein